MMLFLSLLDHWDTESLLRVFGNAGGEFAGRLYSGDQEISNSLCVFQELNFRSLLNAMLSGRIAGQCGEMQTKRRDWIWWSRAQGSLRYWMAVLIFREYNRHACEWFDTRHGEKTVYKLSAFSLLPPFPLSNYTAFFHRQIIKHNCKYERSTATTPPPGNRLQRASKSKRRCAGFRNTIANVVASFIKWRSNPAAATSLWRQIQP